MQGLRILCSLSREYRQASFHIPARANHSIGQRMTSSCFFSGSVRHGDMVFREANCVAPVLKTQILMVGRGTALGGHILRTSKKACGLPWWLSGKELTCQCRKHRRYEFSPGVGKIPWRMEWQPTPVFSPGEFHGKKSLMGCRP